MTSPAKNIALVAVTLAALVLGGLSWQQRNQLHALQTAFDEVAAERDAAREQIRTTERQLALAEESRRSVPRPAPSVSQVPATNNVSSGGPVPAMAMRMPAMDSEAAQKAMAASTKASLDQRYGALFRRLQLDPGTLDQLKDLLTEKQMSRVDVLRAAQAQGLNPATHQQELDELINSVHEDIDAGIQALLGEERFKEYQQYNENINAYGLLDQVERRLSYTNSPLQEAQTDALLRVLIESAPAANTPAGPEMAGMVRFAVANGPVTTIVGGQPRISEATLAAARGVLSPTQMEALQQMHAEQQSINSAFPQPGGGPPIPVVSGQPTGGPIPLPVPAGASGP